MSCPFTIVGLGEVLWDRFPDGVKFGGAPANFACSTAGLAGNQARVHMASGIGEDELGGQSIESLRERSVDVSLLQVRPQPTGTVTVEIDHNGNASYTFASEAAWDNLQWTEAWRQFATTVDAVCFGTLGQRSQPSCDAIMQFLNATRSKSLRIFDVNVRRPFVTTDAILQSLEQANVLKINEEELSDVSELFQLNGSPIEQLRRLVQAYQLKCVVLTRGPDGAILIRDDEISEAPAAKTDVVDTVGAGDAFTAAVTLGLLCNRPLPEINQLALRAAAYVCSQPGATPFIPHELTTSFRSWIENSQNNHADACASPNERES